MQAGTPGNGTAAPRLVRLAAVAWGCTLAATVVGAVGMVLVERIMPAVKAYDYWAELLVNAPVFATVGGIIATRRPRHTIGWLLLAIGFGGAVQLVVGQYAVVALAAANLPGGTIAAWVAEELRMAFLGTLVLVLLLFPTGALPSPRWRAAVWCAAVGQLAALVRVGLAPGRSEHFRGAENPFGVSGLQPLFVVLGTWSSCLVWPSWPRSARWWCGFGAPAASSASNSSCWCTSS